MNHNYTGTAEVKEMKLLHFAPVEILQSQQFKAGYTGQLPGVSV